MQVLINHFKQFGNRFEPLLFYEQVVYEIEPKPRDHPSSHFRPEPDQPEVPEQTGERVEIVTPSIGEYQRASVVPSTGESKNGSETGSAGSSKEDPIQDATGTTIYVVGVICIIPAAGLVAWIVRYVVRKKVNHFLKNGPTLYDVTTISLILALSALL